MAARAAAGGLAGWRVGEVVVVAGLAGRVAVRVWPHERTFFVHSTRSLNRQKCYARVFYARQPMARVRASPPVGLYVFW
jgi:hypothetical protein